MNRGVRKLLSIGALAGLVAVWAVTLRPQTLGGPALYVVVRGTSMLPVYQGGDLLIVHAAPAYAVGDAVAYRVPKGEIGEGDVVIHRIVGGDGASGFVMQGDHNPAPDPWSPRTSDIVGTAWVVLPGVGRLLAIVHQPLIAADLAGALMVALLVAQPRRSPTIDRPERDRRLARASVRLPTRRA